MSVVQHCVVRRIIIGAWAYKMAAGEKETAEDIRRRRDKAADSIGQYLLQGYRMLASHCPECMVRELPNRCNCARDVSLCWCRPCYYRAETEWRCVCYAAAVSQLVKVSSSYVQHIILLSHAAAERTITSEGVVSSTREAAAEQQLSEVGSSVDRDSQLLFSAEQVLIHKLVDTSKAVLASTSPDSTMVHCRLVCSLCEAVRSVRQLRGKHVDDETTNP